ncbi:MAG: S41 family peptidase [Pseudomonadota bacterium]
MMRVIAGWCVLLSGGFSTASAHDLGPTDKAATLEAVIAHLENEYVNTSTGGDAARYLRNASAEGAFDNIASGNDFAKTLSKLLQQVTNDGHLNVEFSEDHLQPNKTAGEFSAGEMERWYGAHLNFGVEKVERLEGNVGLIDLRVFAPIDMAAETVSAAMNVVAHTDALIIDLRNNGGGIGDMANLVASYLFDGGRKPLTGTYDRPSDNLTQRYTQAYVPGTRFGQDKPVYVLISKNTVSAAEALAYDLQALQRAVIIGEASGGGAHPFEYLPIHPHFILWSVTAESINPITGGNWQGVGVKPDVEVLSNRALEEALKRIHSARPQSQSGQNQ